MNIDKIKLFGNDYNLLYDILDKIYPVGSLYWTDKSKTNGGDPNELFVGRWVQITDATYIRAAGDEDPVDDTIRGSDTVTLTKNNLPKHTHTMAHTHSVSGGVSTKTGYIGIDAVSYQCGCTGYAKYSNSTISDSGSFFVHDTNTKSRVSLNHSHSHNLSVGNPNVNITEENVITDNTTYTWSISHYSECCWERVE